VPTVEQKQTQPLVWLQMSRDSGRRWGYQRIVSLGAIGETTKRARWRHCGSGRNIVLRIGTTMQNRVQWVAGFMDAEVLG
jgi:hypothetical protein